MLHAAMNRAVAFPIRCPSAAVDGEQLHIRKKRDVPSGDQERKSNSGSGLQGVNFLEDCIQALLQLLLCPWLTLGFGKLAVVCKRTTVEIGSFIEQFGFGIILCGHTSSYQLIGRMDEDITGAKVQFQDRRGRDFALKKGFNLQSLEPCLRQLLKFIHAIIVEHRQIEAGLALHQALEARGDPVGKVRKHIQRREIEAYVVLFHLRGSKKERSAVDAA